MKGAGFTVNLPLPSGQDDAAYALACVQLVQPIARAFQPEPVLVSAAHRFAALAQVAWEIAAMVLIFVPSKHTGHPHSFTIAVGW